MLAQLQVLEGVEGMGEGDAAFEAALHQCNSRGLVNGWLLRKAPAASGEIVAARGVC